MGNCCAAKRDPNEKTVLEKGKKVDPKKVVAAKKTPAGKISPVKTPVGKPGIIKQPNSIVKPKVDPKKPVDAKKPTDIKKPVIDLLKPTPTSTDTKKPSNTTPKVTPAKKVDPPNPNASAPSKQQTTPVKKQKTQVNEDTTEQNTTFADQSQHIGKQVTKGEMGVQDYIINIPQLYVFNEENRVIFEAELVMLQFNPDEPEFEEFFVQVTETSFRVYNNKLECYETPESPKIQIPLCAIETVIENFDHKLLAVDDDDNSQFFVPNKFALKLKDDFLKLYLREEYEGVGFDYETLEHIKQYGFQTDENLETFYDYYSNIETALYSKEEEFDQEKVNEVNSSEEGVMLKNKMLIFACYVPESRQQYLHYFNLFAEHGSDWYNQYLLQIGEEENQEDYTDPEINDQQVPNQD